MLVALGPYHIENQMCVSNTSRACKYSCMWMFYEHLFFGKSHNLPKNQHLLQLTKEPTPPAAPLTGDACNAYLT